MKILYFCIVQFYFSVKKNEIMTSVRLWIDYVKLNKPDSED